MTDMVDKQIERLALFVDAYSRVADGMVAIGEAAPNVPNYALSKLRERVFALHTLTEGIAADLRHHCESMAAQVGWQIATYEIAPVAKDSGDVAIEWLTGNSYVPPLRSLDACERVWQIDGDAPGTLDLWGVMVEAITSRLIELRVEMAAPEYDNALYVVDLERFEYDEDADNGEDLASGWKPR